MSESEVCLILASDSPRRRELLERLGLKVVVQPANVDESPYPDEIPAAYALRVAAAKLDAVNAGPEIAVVAADTVVILGDQILGKPKDRANARAMLRGLSGRTHQVITASVVRWGNREARDLATADVRFRPFSPEILEWYVNTAEWADKAGGYAVQGKGALLVERLEGNVQGVVGLPLASLPELFARVGLVLKHERDRLVLRG